MGRRFVDPDCWGDPWYQDLSPINKCFWKYICDNCNCAGVWKVNRNLAEFQIGAKLDWDNLLAAFEHRIVDLTPEKWFIVRFVEFQYGELTPLCKAHIPVIKELKHQGLFDLVCGNVETDRGSKGYTKGIHTLKEKEKEKEKEQEQEKDLVLVPRILPDNNDDVSMEEEDVCVSESIGMQEDGGEGAGACAETAKPKKGEAVKHKHGEYGWVRLSEAEYHRLELEFGAADTAKYIAIVDEYAQRTGNAKKYKDWNLVVRKAIRERWSSDAECNENRNKTSTNNGNGRKVYDYEHEAIEALRSGASGR